MDKYRLCPEPAETAFQSIFHYKCQRLPEEGPSPGEPRAEGQGSPVMARRDPAGTPRQGGGGGKERSSAGMAARSPAWRDEGCLCVSVPAPGGLQPPFPALRGFSAAMMHLCCGLLTGLIQSISVLAKTAPAQLLKNKTAKSAITPTAIGIGDGFILGGG